jgi:hypothetical protein
MGEPDCRESGVGAQLVVTVCRDERAGRREELRRTVGLLFPENGPPPPSQYHTVGIFLR